MRHKCANFYQHYSENTEVLAVFPNHTSPFTGRSSPHTRETIDVLNRATLRLRRILRLGTELVDNLRLLLHLDFLSPQSSRPFRASPGRCESYAGSVGRAVSAAGKRAKYGSGKRPVIRCFLTNADENCHTCVSFDGECCGMLTFIIHHSVLEFQQHWPFFWGTGGI